LKHASLDLLFILFLFSESNGPFEENLKQERKAKSHCLLFREAIFKYFFMAWRQLAYYRFPITEYSSGLV